MSESDLLLDEIRKSMTDMQQQMQNTYLGLENLEVSGECEGIVITISCTYRFLDIGIKKEAMQGGLDAFKSRIREAWKQACDEVQKTTQNKTMELLQTMQIPDELRSMAIEEDKDKAKG